MVTHHGLSNHAFWSCAALPLSPDDRFLPKARFTFDVSAWELFWPLLTGPRW